MGVPGNANALLLRSAAAAGGYQISRSLRFNSSDSAYLSRTPASAGNRRVFTFAFWVKRSALGGGAIFSTGVAYNDFWFGFSNDNLYATYWSSTKQFERITTQVFRDLSAWYHIVLSFNSGTSAKIYVNGEEVTSFSSSVGPAAVDTAVNNTALHNIGRFWDGSDYFSGYLADVYFIDGQALTPSSFTETDATTGQLIPKAYTGSYGSQGWHLEFADNSSNTATTLGKDTSGNSNNWTPNNLSVTAGAGNDSLVDTPTSYGTGNSGGDVRGNYCTLNPLDNGGGTLSNGNLDFSNLTTAHRAVRSTIALPNSGKFYAELTVGTTNSASVGVGFGFATQGANLTNDPANTGKWSIYLDGIRSQTTTVTSGLGYFQANDILQIAYDGATGNAWVGKNNVWYNSTGGTTGNPGAGTNPTFTLTDSVFPYCSLYNATAVLNGGARAFAYTAPSGFKALCDTNLPAPVVAKPNTVMDVALYTGTGSAQTISGLGFSPDLVWVKQRNGGQNNILCDVVRGVNNYLVSDSTQAEATSTTITAFNSDGFSVGGGGAVGGSGSTYVGWTWDAGSSTITNTQGSITSQVRANATAGFSVVTFTAQSSGSATIGHGLGVEPYMIIIKSRDQTYNWCVYHKSLTSNAYFLNLNTTAAQSNTSNVWNNTTPTSSVFSLGSGYAGAGATVAYCFSPVVGYSSFGSYVGNGSADGPFIYTGFRPKFILVKNTSVAGAWEIYDSVRNPYNVMALTLLPNASDAEITASNGVRIDFTSNGFKWRDNGSSINGSGNTIIWAAFAESPFQYARAR